MDVELEKTIIRNLLTNDSYLRKVIPHLKREYFEGVYNKIFHQLSKFVAKYNKLPTLESLKIDIEKSDIFNDDDYQNTLDILPSIFEKKEENIDWLMDTTEKWCQDRSLYLAIMKSIEIIDGKDQILTKDSLPSILQDALAVCFDNNVGHDYLNDAESRYEFYHEEFERIPFDIDEFNTITKGGLANKTLSVILAGTGVGKSLAMCHFASSFLSMGKNVLYLTMEMAEERIAERIDANLLNVPLDQIDKLSKSMFTSKVADLAKKTNGNLIVKEYPTAAAHSGHFRALINELKLKKKFVPDVIFVDYLNICASSRVKQGGGVNSYTYVKSIAEELRGLAIEFNLPLVTATQTTRTGYSSSDPGLDDTSESFGLPATADFFFALISNEELAAQNHIMVKPLKSRFYDVTKLSRFPIGINKSMMRLSQIDETESDRIPETNPKSIIGNNRIDDEKLRGIKIS